MAGTGYAYASAQTVLQLGIETTRGTAAIPEFAIPVKSPKYKVDLTVIEDETLQGTMAQVYDQVPGMRYDSHGWDGYPYLDLFGALVRCELGSADTLTTAAAATTLSTAVVAGATTVKTAAELAAGDFVVIGSGATQETHQIKSVAGTTAPFTAVLVYPLIYAHAAATTVTGLTGHAFSLLNTAGEGNQPPSATLYDYDGERCRELTAAQMDELTIKGNADTFVTYTCSWFANPAVTVTQPTPSFSGVQAPPGWTFTGSVDGTVLNTIQTWEISFKRGTKPIPGLTGSQEYFEYFAGPIQATAKLTFLEQSGSPQLAAFEAGTIGAYDFTFYDTRTGYIFNAHSTKAAFKTGDLDRSKEWVEVPLTVQLLPSATDATAGGGGRSPAKVSIGNARATAY